MADAKRDNNYVPTLIAVSSSDGTTPVILWADPTTHRLLVSVAAGGGVDWTEVTDTSVSAAVNNGYILNNAGTVTLTIPTTAAVGDVVRVVGKGAGGWTIAQNASESINYGDATTTSGVGGSLSSTHRYDCIDLVCTVANTTWTVTSSIGNITVV